MYCIDAFADGKLELDIDVDPKLEALDNPYDWGARDGIGYAWDHLLVDGKYYSYYGICTVTKKASSASERYPSTPPIIFRRCVLA